ncbi:hypothetical protein OGAPHI_001899 [Ogataea philodendri]|uniref:Uncharacterized protein n=1 Tax=Ogataea philodendri TaxID=1378263 RepID=A0A9P8PAE5_9ASCO|nr:uncharacterized protein OGAPHI_001899 [Ogataea philodendri]KAH3668145.1 hypothetical protein OGAPHI_001899 [Ogataea philodendri]
MAVYFCWSSSGYSLSRKYDQVSNSLYSGFMLTFKRNRINSSAFFFKSTLRATPAPRTVIGLPLGCNDCKAALVFFNFATTCSLVNKEFSLSLSDSEPEVSDSASLVFLLNPDGLAGAGSCRRFSESCSLACSSIDRRLGAGGGSGTYGLDDKKLASVDCLAGTFGLVVDSSSTGVTDFETGLAGSRPLRILSVSATI